MSVKATIHFDGGSRGNPGIAGAGAVVTIDNETHNLVLPIQGEATNNYAEYYALHEAVKKVLEVDDRIELLEIYGDSKLVIEQVQGNWQVKSNDLKDMHREIQRGLNECDHVILHWIPRADNSAADALANQAMDQHDANSQLEEDNTLTVMEDIIHYIDTDMEADFNDDPERVLRMLQGLRGQLNG